MRFFLAASLAAAASVLAGAPSDAAAQEGGVAPLEPITVEGASGSGLKQRELEQTLSNVPGGTNLINLETRKGSQATLASVLDFEPGIIIQEFFGGNDQPRLNIRGSGIQDNPVSRGVQLLYDGLPLNQADGSFIIGLLDPEQAQFISVYRGANAMRYGATTLGGAIDFSLRNAGNSSSSASIEAGSYGMRKGALSLAQKSDDWDIYLRASRYQSDGWRDHSEASRNNLALNVGLQRGNWENRTYLNYTDNKFDIPFLLTKDRALSDPRSVMGDYTHLPADQGGLFEQFLNVRTRDPYRDTEQLRLANKTTWYGEIYEQTFGVYGEKVNDKFKNPASQANTDATNYGVDYALDYTHLGSGWRKTEYQFFLSANTGRMPREYFLVSPVDGSLVRPYADLGQRADNVIMGAQVLQDLVPDWQGLVALQYAYNKRKIEDRKAPGVLDSNFDYTALNPKVGLIYTPSENSRYYANVSRSSEAPTFWQLADLGAGSNPGSPSSLYLQVNPLRMQTANTFEIGTQQRSRYFSWEASYYYSRVKHELIAEVRDFAIDGTTVNYTDPTKHQGIELGFSARTKTGIFSGTDYFTVRGVYNWSDFRFKGGRYDGKRIAGVPVHLISGEIGYQFSDRAGVSLNARWQPSDTHVDHQNADLKQDAYFLLGSRFFYRPNKKWEFFVDLHNITDETYQTAYVVRGYSPDNPTSPLNMPTFVPGPGFHATAGLTMRW